MKSNAFVNGYLEGYFEKQAGYEAAEPTGLVGTQAAATKKEVSQGLAQKNQRQADAARANRSVMTNYGKGQPMAGGAGMGGGDEVAVKEDFGKGDMAAAQAQRRQNHLNKLRQSSQAKINQAGAVRAENTANAATNTASKAQLGQERAGQRQRELGSRRQALSQQIHGKPTL
jgi:hypothetical protein